MPIVFSPPLPRLLGATTLLTALFFAADRPLHAAAHDIALTEVQAVSELEARAQQAGPRDQCFLYTELVSSMTELAGKQMLLGDVDQASTTLRRIEHYSQLIHLGLARDTKRVKNAEMLMQHTTFRLNEILHKASGDDRAILQSTLKQLNGVQEELLTQVLLH